MPGFVTLLINHRPKALRGASLLEALAVEERQPDRLAAYRRPGVTCLRACVRHRPS